jgi:hypothetical protein
MVEATILNLAGQRDVNKHHAQKNRERFENYAHCDGGSMGINANRLTSSRTPESRTERCTESAVEVVLRMRPQILA